MNWFKRFWSNNNNIKEVTEEIPWWYCATIHDVIEKKVDVSQLLDEMVEYHAKHKWATYAGMEPLALLLLIERYENRK